MKIDGIDNKYKAYKTWDKHTTQSSWRGIVLVRPYRTPTLRNPAVINTIDTLHAIRLQAWINLPDIEKTQWDAEGKESGISGFYLFEQETWKTFVNSRCKKGRVGTARLGGSIRSGIGGRCGLNYLGINYLGGNVYP